MDCMLKSDCVLKQGNTVRECFKEEHADDVPKECHSILKSFYECRRGMVSLFLGFIKDTIIDLI